MLSDRDALLAAIRANPEEDTPRLMFADWLDEHGQPERAEFIRAQCELARLADDGSDSQPVYEFLRDRDYVTRPSADWVRIDDGIHRRITLAARADELIAAHGADWLPRLPKRFRLEWGGFRRGFPHRLTLNDFRTRHLAELAPRLRATVPAVALVAGTFNDRSTRQLADADLLGHISGLELSYDCWAGLREFGRRPEAAGVRTLTVRSSYPAEVAAALVDSPRLTGLRELDLSLTPLSATDAEELFRAPHLRALKRLRVLGHRWTAETVRALAAGGFGQLTSLRLTHAALDDEAAEVLAGCPALAGLRDLDLGHNAITGRGVTALLTSPHLANVAFLGLEANPCGGVDADRLAAAAPGGLRMLHCHDSRFRTSDVRALARCPRLRTLWYLDLDAHNIGTPAVRELVRGFKDFCPPVVWLTYNRIDDRGAELLAKWKAARALRVLHLRYNPDMTDAGARALLDSPHLTNLDDLGVSNVGAETT
ncbi:MAG: TIGR02996 domain-containing protein, partial [Planctomycetes bacterium]|nr:TIGR02996 domain-containing protein [Planctomycetota bacterium]